ncbi:thioredoxin [Desulfosporosinus fructosivorans]
MAGANVKTFTTANFDSEVLKSEKAVLVDFWASWCNPCLREAPIIDELADEYLGQIVVGMVDVDDNDPIVSNYSVVSIPTLAIFKGGKVVDIIAGFHEKKELVKMLNDQL